MMAEDDTLEVKERFEAVTKDSSLDILLPRSADVDAIQFLQQRSPDKLIRAASRRNFYFDERTTLTLLLKVPATETILTELLQHLEITVAAHATDSGASLEGNSALASGKHDLTSKQFAASNPDIVAAVGKDTYAIWKTDLHIQRPRARLQRPAIYFSASLSLTPAALAASQRSHQELMTGYESLPRNVLEPLQYDPALRSSNVQLSENRVTKIAPAAADPRSEAKPLRGASKRAFPVLPALLTRIRYSALPDAIIASLHIETPRAGLQQARINDVRVDVPDAIVEDLSDVTYPIEALGGDETVILKRLRKLPELTNGEKSVVTVKIDASVLASDEFNVPLTVSWQAQINLRNTTPQPVYRWSRPQNVVNLQDSRTSLLGPSDTLSRTNSHTLSSNNSQTLGSADGSVVFTFASGPATKSDHGEMSLKIQCVNRSARPRRFALVMTQAKRPQVKYTRSTEKGNGEDRLSTHFDTAPPKRRKLLNVVDLNPDLRIGPLAPGSCYETSMDFQTLAKEFLDLGVMKIVDLDTRQTVDVRQLPDVSTPRGVGEEKHALINTE